MLIIILMSNPLIIVVKLEVAIVLAKQNTLEGVHCIMFHKIIKTYHLAGDSKYFLNIK